jgi:hypothetical protein
MPHFENCVCVANLALVAGAKQSGRADSEAPAVAGQHTTSAMATTVPQARKQHEERQLMSNSRFDLATMKWFVM